MLEYSFMDNAVYGADDINAAFARLTTKGVSLYKDNSGSVTVAQELNHAFANYASRGVEIYNPTACMVIKKSDGSFAVKPGTAIMGNGSMVTVTEEEVLSVSASGTHYIYFDVNTAFNRIDLVCSEKPPSGSDFVMLASVESGKVVDRREFAKTKLAPSLANLYISKSVSIYTSTHHSDSTMGTEVARVDAGWTGWQYAKISYVFDGTAHETFGDALAGFSAMINQWTTCRFKKEGQYLVVTHVSSSGNSIGNKLVDIFVL